ncbi:hypothetical protein ACHAWF_008818, partial [Thalassiosira exigua]
TGIFTSLLNLREQIAYHGDKRWYWEGTRERFIQAVKKMLSSMRCGDYSGKYYRYDSLATVKDKFSNGTILSGFALRDSTGTTYEDRLFIAYGNPGVEMSAVAISLRQFDEQENSCGLTYGKCQLGNEVTTNRVGMEDRKVHYCLFLTLIENGRTFGGRYAIVIVYDDWSVRTRCGPGGKHLPFFCSDLMGTDVLSTNYNYLNVLRPPVGGYMESYLLFLAYSKAHPTAVQVVMMTDTQYSSPLMARTNE